MCVWPEHVARCAAELAGTRVRIATVVNFPSGDEPRSDVARQTTTALDDGANEIDVVIPYRSLIAGDTTPQACCSTPYGTRPATSTSR